MRQHLRIWVIVEDESGAELHGAVGAYQVHLHDVETGLLIDLLRHDGVAAHYAVHIVVDESFGKDGSSPGARLGRERWQAQRNEGHRA